jgi:surfactin synthase thioesterase subunit
LSSKRIPAFFAPGFKQSYYVDTVYSSTYRGTYRRLFWAIEQAGFEPFYFQPDWRKSNPLQWAADMAVFANSVTQERKVDEFVLAGFSCGALIAVLAAHNLENNTSPAKMNGLAAYSLSPWFGPERVRHAYQHPDSGLHEADLSLVAALNGLELPRLVCPIQIYVGTQETYAVREMHTDALAQWPHAESIRPPTAHNIFDDSYLRAIEMNMGRLATRIQGVL